MFDGSVYPKNLMQMFEYLQVLRYRRCAAGTSYLILSYLMLSRHIDGSCLMTVPLAHVLRTNKNSPVISFTFEPKSSRVVCSVNTTPLAPKKEKKILGDVRTLQLSRGMSVMPCEPSPVSMHTLQALQQAMLCPLQKAMQQAMLCPLSLSNTFPVDQRVHLHEPPA
jgi:hypothetical protein